MRIPDQIIKYPGLTCWSARKDTPATLPQFPTLTPDTQGNRPLAASIARVTRGQVLRINEPGLCAKAACQYSVPQSEQQIMIAHSGEIGVGSDNGGATVSLVF